MTDDRQIPPLDWFGRAWDAELCASKPPVRVPAGDECEGCHGLITYGANGIVAPESDEIGVRMAVLHLRCFRRSNALGSDQV